MKESDKDKPIKSVPEGVWESSRPKKSKGKDINTDLQGNGYPVNRHDTSITDEMPHKSGNSTSTGTRENEHPGYPTNKQQ